MKKDEQTQSVDYMESNKKFNNKQDQNKHYKDDKNYSKDGRQIENCKFCSYSHPRGKCPAYTKNCNNSSKSYFPNTSNLSTITPTISPSYNRLQLGWYWTNPTR